VDAFLILKFVHVSLAILWLGGGMCLILLAAFLGRNPADDRLMTIVRLVAIYAPRVFVPSSVLVLLSGIGTVHLGGFGWQAWVILGLAGVAFTGLFGARVLGPLADRAVRAAEAGGDAAGAADGRRLLRLARFDYVVQFAIVYLMVVKPGWDDIAPLALVAVAIAAGAALILRGGEVRPA
jgi:uncharacterized membrane protein